MSPDLIERYAGLQVPRYTSYPTGADFSPAVGATDHAGWLARTDPDESVSVYLHVPYCRALCHYCGCHAKMALRDEVVGNYRRVLSAEIGIVGRHLRRPLKVSRLHWGGGTPSIVEADGLAAVLDALAGPFVLDDAAEHAIELDPRGVTPDLARRLARLGVNRVSLGVQDLDPVVQLAIGRVQPFSLVRNAVDDLRAAGISRISIDLLHGLPFQTAASVAETARRALELAPDRVACFAYAHMPERRRNQRLIDAAALPGTRERFEQARVATDVLVASGYVAIGIDHFARVDDPLAGATGEGRLHRNFQGYTDDDRTTLIGLGASAISRFRQGFVQNEADTGRYRDAVALGRLPSSRGHAFCGTDRARGAIIEQLMCRHRVDLDTFGGRSHFEDELAVLRGLADDGLLTIDGDVIAMTRRGRPFVRVVAAAFDSYRRAGAGRFSTAV